MTYIETHPWMDFKPDISNLPHILWMLLGEAKAKCQHITEVPLKPGIATELGKVSLAKGVLATTAIEGNTLTQEDVLAYLDGRLDLPLSKQYLGTEIKNIINACNQIAANCLEEITVDVLKNYNSLVLKNLPLSDEVSPGEIRTHDVRVGSYKPPNWQDCNYLVNKFCEWYESLKTFELDKELKIPYGIIRAVLAHLYFVWIHPFADGNGRTARLIELKTLLCVGVPAFSAHLLSNHYNETRDEYYRQLDKASKTGKVIDFISYSVRGFVDQLNEQLKLIRTQQLRIAWKDYVYEIFSGKNSPGDVRRRRLVLDLSIQNSPVNKSQITNISADIAREYFNKAPRTLTRDLNLLEEMNLIRLTPNGYIANKEIILAFLSPTQDPPLLKL